MLSPFPPTVRREKHSTPEVMFARLRLLFLLTACNSISGHNDIRRVFLPSCEIPIKCFSCPALMLFPHGHVSVLHFWSAASLSDKANDAMLTFIDSSPQVTTSQLLCLFCDAFLSLKPTRKRAVAFICQSLPALFFMSDKSV